MIVVIITNDDEQLLVFVTNNLLNPLNPRSMSLSIQNVSKAFGETRALNGVSFDIARGEIVALLGPSGCGKSTLLGLIAGLDEPDQGEILWEGQSLAGTPPHRRGFGLMFQDYMLFPHMNVGQNVAFGLKFINNLSSSAFSTGKVSLTPTPSGRGFAERERVQELLALVGLPGFERRDVSTLSGGEQQRVALARSLAPRPRLLMLDEPLGALDRTLRERLLVELREILRQLTQTAIYVTHDQEEAFAIADRIVILRAGQVEQLGAAPDIYRQPASPFVARFLGFGNLFKGIGQHQEHGWKITTELGQFSVSGETPRLRGGEGTVLIRPDGVRPVVEGETGPENVHLEGIVREISFRGSVQRLAVSVNGLPLTFDLPADVTLPGVGDGIRLAVDERAIQIFQD